MSLALQDRNPYVRRTAVLGVLKIYNLDAAAVRNAGKQVTLSSIKAIVNMSDTLSLFLAGMLDDLHDMLQKDPDAQVVANCMSVLLEVRRCKYSVFEHVTVCLHAAACPQSQQPMLNAVTSSSACCP